MKQKAIITVMAALNRADTAAAAANEHAAAIGVTRNTSAAITADRTALGNQYEAHKKAKLEMVTRIAALHGVLALVFRFVLTARDLLKIHLGNQHSKVWETLGFKGTLRIPRTFSGLKALLESLAAYLAANEAKQVAALNITAARAQELLNALNSAHTAVQSQKTKVGDLKKQRDSLFVTLKKRLRSTFRELQDLLDPLDDRFVSYGFNKPGALSIPEVPQNVVVIPVGAQSASVKWDGAARAERYRIWTKVVGVDQEMVLAATREELDVVLGNLPENATIETAVSAINNGGESARSPVVTVTTQLKREETNRPPG